MERNYPIKLQVMICGEAGSGKTSIMLKFAENKFETTYIPSLGVDFRTRVISLNAFKISIELWDMASSYEQLGLLDSSYKVVNAILIIFDKSNRESFENVNAHINKIRKCAFSDVILFLVGNKSDLIEKISSDEGAEKALKHNIYYADVSAKTGDQLEMVFRIIANKFLEKDFDRIKKL